MTKGLFSDFDPVSAKAWKQKIQLDLKGADYNKTLIWNSLEGIDVKPFYHSEDINHKDLNVSITPHWTICENILVTNEKSANAQALNVIEKGAESIRFNLSEEDINLNELLRNISTPIYIKLDFLSNTLVEQLDKYALSNQKNIAVEIDIIGRLAKTGNWYSGLKEDHKVLNTIVANCKALKSLISIDVTTYQNAGATITQQLAYALAHANEYLNHFNGNLDKPMVFKFSIGSNYFFEIAKLRAFRLLWDTLISAYNHNMECHIDAIPSSRNKTLYDYNTNLLRTTTECMSAILGGANTISNLAYDSIYHNHNEFGERIARNQLLILKHESNFDKVQNPTSGAYYIEELTEQLASKSLQLFKNIESNGGFLKQLKVGTIQRKIKESANKEQELFDNEKIVLLGTNKHQNPEDKMKGTIEKSPFIETKPRKTLIEPVIEKRLSEQLDKNRLEKEK